MISFKRYLSSISAHLFARHPAECFAELISGRGIIFRDVGLNRQLLFNHMNNRAYQKSKPSFICDLSELRFKLTINDIDLFILSLSASPAQNHVTYRIHNSQTRQGRMHFQDRQRLSSVKNQGRERTFVSSLSKCLKVASNSSNLAGVILVCVAETICQSAQKPHISIGYSPDSRRKLSSYGCCPLRDQARIQDHQKSRLYNRFLPLLLPGNFGPLPESCHSDVL